jgi:hypothetical protein
VNPAASYVLPIRRSEGGPSPELTAYLAWLATALELIVVDGSPPAVFDTHRAAWRHIPLRHLQPDPRFPAANGKVRGVLTGVWVASHDRVVIADDDVRYDHSSLARTVDLLDSADLVRPQNYFDPMPWHGLWDTARTLLNRAGGADYPGTLAIRRSLLLAAGGYDGDVLFENLELIRTMKAAGGRAVAPLDLYVPRRPPTFRHFRGQRVRQAYDDLAQPARLALELSIAPAMTAALVRPGHRKGAALLAGTAAIMGVAELGRRRGGGRQVFPPTAPLMAPLWVLERAICVWVAVYNRLVRGGCPYAGGVLRRAANPTRTLRAATSDRYLQWSPPLRVGGTRQDPKTLGEDDDGGLRPDGVRRGGGRRL